MNSRATKISLIAASVVVCLAGCVTTQGPKPSSRVTAVNGNSGNEQLIEDFRGFLRDNSEGWYVQGNFPTVAQAEYVSIQDEQGNKFSIGYREWLAVCYSGSTTYIKALTRSEMNRLKELIGRASGGYTASDPAMISQNSMDDRYDYLRSIWPDDSILTPTTTEFARFGFVYTGLIDNATIEAAKAKYRTKFGEELLLKKF